MTLPELLTVALIVVLFIIWVALMIHRDRKTRANLEKFLNTSSGRRENATRKKQRGRKVLFGNKKQ